MNDRERFKETMTFGTPDRIPFWECAFWNETLARWTKEGMPEEVLHPDGPDSNCTEESLRSYFGFDRSFGVYFRDTIRVNIGLEPAFEREILAKENGKITERGPDGVVTRWAPKGHSTRQFIRFPVTSRDDFSEIKKRFDPHTAARFHPGWKERALELQNAGVPICLRVGGYYGYARSLMGLENLSLAFYDKQDLIADMFEFRTEYIIQILEKVLQQVQPDFAEFWEDMAYKNGSLVSPSLYRKLALKHYQQVTDLLKKYGVDIILVDSDGNVDELIPIWLDGGLTAVWPLEVAAGMDPVALRKEYGTSLAMIGGIDKRVLASGKEEIKEEVMKKVPYLVETGGYIPTCDHAVPEDISLENYLYYLKLIKDIALN